METMKKPSAREVELERLRRELLRRIIANESRRQTPRVVAAK
jgi:hypothetical protein